MTRFSMLPYGAGENFRHGPILKSLESKGRLRLGAGEIGP